jgi:hypothetical protein
VIDKLIVQPVISLSIFGAQTSASTSLERLTSAIRDLGLKAKRHAISVADIDSGVHGITLNGRRTLGQTMCGSCGETAADLLRTTFCKFVISFGDESPISPSSYA